MIGQIATMPKESRRLLRAGVDPETADMYYTTEKAPIYEDVMDTVDVLHNTSYDAERQAPEDGATIPAWSLERLLDLIPKKIYRPDPSLCDPDNPDEIPPIMEWYWEMTATDRVSYEDKKTGIKLTEEPRYAITYCSYQVLPPTHPIAPNSLNRKMLFDDDGNHMGFVGLTAVNAAVGCIVWLLEHGYQLNKL